MELTIVLNISSDSSVDDISKTLDSIPWDNEGVDLVIYSEDTQKIKKIISSEDLDSTIIDSDVNVLFCELPYSSDDTYKNIALEDTKTELVTFLQPGDTIEYFDEDLLKGEFDFGLSGIDDKSQSYVCYESRMLPKCERGIVYKVEYLKKKNLSFGSSFLPKLFDIKELSSPQYWDGWGKYDVSELFSISVNEESKLEDDLKLPEIYTKLWNSHEVSYNDYLRDLMWNRMTRSAALVISRYPDSYGKYSTIFQNLKYLFPDNKSRILC